MKPSVPARRVLDIAPLTEHSTFRPAPWTEPESRLLRLLPAVAAWPLGVPLARFARG